MKTATTKRKTLFIIVNKAIFDKIENGTMTEITRENTPYWQKRLLDKEFEFIEIRNGYMNNRPKVRFKWSGYTLKNNTFAIKLVK